MKRYAIYYAPPEGAFATRAAGWLGWDAARGQAVAQPDLGLPAADMTTEPRRYGFHGTIKAPFRLASGQDVAGLRAALARLAAELAPVSLPGLQLSRHDGFLALTPEGDATALRDLAARVVTGLDAFRAPLTDAEIARRRPERLTPRQRALLDRYGYPFVLEEFRFHLTLTNRLDPDLADRAEARLRAHFAPVLPRPFLFDALCLFGEPAEGPFRLLERFALRASAST